MIRKCKKHGETEHKPRYKDGKIHGYRCSQCNIEDVSKHRQRRKIKAVQHKGGKCVKCGYDKHVAALDFHHVRGKKEFNISGTSLVYPWKKVKKELDKCDLLCANCHREEHASNTHL